MPSTTETRAPVLSYNSFVSLGLVGTLVAGAMVFGKQLQRMDTFENELRELRSEVRDLRGSPRSQTSARTP